MTKTLEFCPNCGAIQKNGCTCESVFNEFLALEFTDIEYGAYHMLTVACYMIQHGRYSHDGLVWIDQKLRDFLEKGLSSEQIRRHAVIEVDQKKRSWRVVRKVKDFPQQKINWSMTIMDIADHYNDAESYRDLIWCWAVKTLEDMQPLLPNKCS